LRAYFSRPQSLPDLKEALGKKKQSEAILRKLDQEEVQPAMASPLSADAGPAVCPDRHYIKGRMRDRDGEMRPWNDRWSTGVHMLNDQLHPLHRQYFVKKSLFEEAPSQRWRRHLDFEVSHGVWRPIGVKKGELFPPMGV